MLGHTQENDKRYYLQKHKYIESLSSDTSQNNPEFVIFPAEMLFGFVTVEATI